MDAEEQIRINIRSVQQIKRTEITRAVYIHKTKSKTKELDVFRDIGF